MIIGRGLDEIYLITLHSFNYFIMTTFIVWACITTLIYIFLKNTINHY